MKHRKYWLLCGLLVLALCLGLFGTAAAADPAQIVLSTSEELLQILQDDGTQTAGKTYILGDDLQIDTSSLETVFTAGATNAARKFRGVLDGQGHTITVTENGQATAQPLFDAIEGTSQSSAAVRNLKIVFQGNVTGAALAAKVGKAELSNIEIRFEKDILFAPLAEAWQGRAAAVATGVFAFPMSSGPIQVSDVQVLATGGEDYGYIGQNSARDETYLLAAGVYSERNLAGTQIVLDGITVQVRGIYAVSGAQADQKVYCGAAGVVTGFDSNSSQTNARVGNASVTVQEDICASAPNGADGSELAAYGIGADLLAMYQCSVQVGGQISAAFDTPGPGQTAYAAGLGYSVSTKYNQSVFGASETGVCRVEVAGDIAAVAGNAVACGAAMQSGHHNTWRNVTISAQQITARSDGSDSAAAIGLIYQPLDSWNTSGDAFDYENCSVSVQTISAVSPGDGAYAMGLMQWGYGSAKDCSVQADVISSQGTQALSAGLMRRFSPNTDRYNPSGDYYGELDGCSVTARQIVATDTTEDSYSAGVAGLVYEASAAAVREAVRGGIRNCSVQVSETFAATGTLAEKGLLVGQNKSSYGLWDNQVILPEDQAQIVTLPGDESEYVRFTTWEKAGQAEKSANADQSDDWEQGNQVIFTGSREGSVGCAFDSGSSGGTLWKLTQTAAYYPVSFDLNGGTPASGVSYETQMVRQGDEVTLPAAPERTNWNFTGWSDGQQSYDAGQTVIVQGAVTFTAQWEPKGALYTLHYETDGGTVYDDEEYLAGTVVPLDKTPQREGWRFTGWYADAACSEKMTSVTMDKNRVVYAGWIADVPEILDGENHLSYLSGYPDGTVRPEAELTRAEAAAIFYRLLDSEVRDEAYTTEGPFADVPEDSWFNSSVNTLASLGILAGRTETSFAPNDTITRAEFAAICARFDQRELELEQSFSDIAGHWAAEEICRAAELGWVNGYPDGSFRPDETITRAEAVTMVNHVLQRLPGQESDLLEGMRTWPDNQPDAWYYLAIQEATNSHTYSRRDDDTEQWLELLPLPEWKQLAP